MSAAAFQSKCDQNRIPAFQGKHEFRHLSLKVSLLIFVLAENIYS